MTYGSRLEFSWRGFRLVFFFFFVFCIFLLFFFFRTFSSSWSFDSIRPVPGKEAAFSFSLFPLLHSTISLSLAYLFYSVFILCISPRRLLFFFFGSFDSDLLVLETPPGQRAERFSAPPASWPCDRGPIRNEPMPSTDVGVQFKYFVRPSTPSATNFFLFSSNCSY